MDFLLTVGTATISFFAWHLLGKQIIEFYDLRKQIQEELIYGSNLWKPVDEFYKDEIHNIIRKTKRLSAQLRALDHSLTFLSKYLLYKLFGMDLITAVGGLWIYHNDPFDENALRTESRHTIEKALNLPLTDTIEKVQQTRIVRKIEKQFND